MGLASTVLTVLTIATVYGLAYAGPSDSPSGVARLAAPFSPSALTVDLGYGLYQGSFNTSTGLNVWRGIRFAAAPVGTLRWQAPQVPSTNRTVVNADSFGAKCPQAFPNVPKAAFIPGDEDCLFLNVYAPPTSGSRKLPVLVWIHGGGYGLGDGTQDLTEIINDNDNSFIAVSIQYRLGAFGYLSSAEVKSNGVVNAGLLDQRFALKWVQSYIDQFGGDMSQVTISGESAGGGSVMYHVMGAGGTLGTTLFKNAIAASPYLIAQFDADADAPTERYFQFSESVGCGSSGRVFKCLVGKDSMTLQQASANMSDRGAYGTWPFWPVTDGEYVKELASVQLKEKRVNGENLFVGHNADEGAMFVPPGIVTDSDLTTWLRQEFPHLPAERIASILTAYPPTPSPPSGALFATSGTHPPTANDVSPAAAGPQQRANNILAEATFACPAYWLADAYAQPGKAAFAYQYSVPFAAHGADVAAYLGPATDNQGRDFTRAWRRMWGGFVARGNPSVPGAVANGAGVEGAENPAAAYPVWMQGDATMLVLNQTGGERVAVTTGFGANVTQMEGPGLRNDIYAAKAGPWEGGRAKRCEFWMGLSPQVPQ